MAAGIYGTGYKFMENVKGDKHIAAQKIYDALIEMAEKYKALVL